MKIKCLLLGIVLAWGLIPASSVFAVDVQDFYFTDFTADYYLTKAEDGTGNLHVKEVLTAVFPDYDQNHGINRMIPLANQNKKNRVVASKDALNLTVLRNGNPEPINKITDDGDYYTIYIGEADKYVHGKQVYTLEYDYTNVITEFDAEGHDVSGAEDAEKAFQELYWDTNGTQWQQSFGKVTVNLHTTESIYKKMSSQAKCYVGRLGFKGEGRCLITPTSDGFSFTAEGIKAYENLTFATTFKPDTFKVVIHKHYILVVTVILESIAAIAFLIYRYVKWRKTARSQYRFYKSLFVAPQYQPPADADIHVAEGGKIYLKRTGKSYTATLLELAVEKKVTIKKPDSWCEYDWAMVPNIEPTEISGARKYLINIIADGEFKKGEEVGFQKHASSSYLEDCVRGYSESAIDTLEKNGYLLPGNGKIKVGVTLGLLLMILPLALIFGMLKFGDFAENYISRLDGVVIGKEFLPTTIFSIFIITMVVSVIINDATRKYSRYTEKGLELSNYLEGLKLYIGMAEAERLKFLQSVKGVDTSNNGIAKLYEKLLPWAALFGLEKSWASEMEKYYEAEDITKAIDIGVLDGVATSSISSDVGKAFSFGDNGGSWSSGDSGGGGGGSSGGGGGGGGGGGW